MICAMVPADLINTCWDKIEPYLEKACKYSYGRYNTEDLKEMIEEGIFHLWISYNKEEERFYGAVVTQFMAYPRVKYLSLSFCGGKELIKWQKPMLNILRKFAADTGCEGLEAAARRGWAKLLEKEGYQSRWVTFDLPLEGA